MGVEYGPAIDMFVDPSRTFVGAQPRGAIVVHKSAGFDTPQECAQYFATNPGMVVSHFIIGLDGTVVQCCSLSNGACANCCVVGAYDKYWDGYGGVNLNTVTISIEHIDNHKDANGNYDNQGVCPEAQLEASFALCLWLRDNYDMQWPDVKTHASIDPVNRSRCPGNYPMDSLIQNMRYSGMTVTTITSNQNSAFHTQWRAHDANLPTDTGIYKLWAKSKANGLNLNAPTSHEYQSIDWNGKPIIVQEGGNWWCEWANGAGTIYKI